MKLLAEIKDPELLMKLQHEKGSTFFRPVAEGEAGEYEVVYFSDSRTVLFKGKLSAAQLENLKALGTQCTIIDLDVNLGFVRIVE